VVPRRRLVQRVHGGPCQTEAGLESSFLIFKNFVRKVFRDKFLLQKLEQKFIHKIKFQHNLIAPKNSNL
jgi:hypothetical protein